MKQILLYTFMFIAFVANAQDYSGKWSYVHYNEDSDDVPYLVFTLILTQEGNSISGQHIGVSHYGRRIDASFRDEETVNGKIINNHANVIIKPTYSYNVTTGTAKLEHIGRDSLHFKFTRKPTNGEYFIPDDVILIRQAD